MGPKNSVTYPSLLVYEDGRVKHLDTGEFLQPQEPINPTSSTGPVVRFRMGKYTRYLSIQTLVYECYVKGKKKDRGEIVSCLDGDPYNYHRNNLVKYSRIDKGSRNKDEDYNGTWLNGDDEIFM